MKVLIIQKSANPMQSGRGKLKNWYIEPALNNSRPAKSSTFNGWTGATSTQSQIKLQFNSLHNAVEFSVRKGWDYEIITNEPTDFVLKSYADVLDPNRVSK